MISYDNIIQVLTTDGPKVVKSHQKRLWVQSLFSPTKEPFHLEERLQFFYQTHTSATVAGHIDTWQAVDARKLWGFLEELILPTRILIGKARSCPTICSKTTSWYLIHEMMLSLPDSMWWMWGEAVKPKWGFWKPKGKTGNKGPREHQRSQLGKSHHWRSKSDDGPVDILEFSWSPSMPTYQYHCSLQASESSNTGCWKASSDGKTVHIQKQTIQRLNHWN